LLIRLSVFAALLLLMAQAISGARGVSAEGEATDLAVESQTCTDGFTVQVVLSWTPSSTGQQWVDFSLKNDGFEEPYFHGGPFGAGQSQATLRNLEAQRNYYVRVSTRDGDGWLRSDLFAFKTGCKPYEATGPLHVSGASISDTAVRFSWEPGNGNLWYCVDYASTVNDLLNKTGTWRNSGCGTTSTTHVIDGLRCERTFHARVWAWTTQGGHHSANVKVSTQPCARTITPPTDLRAVFTAPRLARVDWEPGSNNIWYCVDTARSQSDLLSFSGTWENDCGFKQSELELRILRCDTEYYYRVYTWNYYAHAHSVVKNFKTAACGLDDTPAKVLDLAVHKSEDGAYRAEVLVELSNGCQSPGFYRIDRDGNKIEIELNNLVEDAPIACSLATDTHLWSIDLGFFNEGLTYEVDVNGEASETFTAS
jgi:hypothetical protein